METYSAHKNVNYEKYFGGIKNEVITCQLEKAHIDSISTAVLGVCDKYMS